MNIYRVAITALISAAGLWATPLTFGTAGYSVNIGKTTKAGSVAETTNIGSIVYGDLAKNGYALVMTWDVDPTLSWSFTTTLSGLHTLQFYMGFPRDRFYQIFTSAGYTITGNRKGKGATVSDMVLKPYSPLPIGAKNYIPEGLVTVKGTKTVKGTLTRSNDNSNSGGVGDYVSMPVRNVKNMGVEITFNTTIGSGDRFSMNGTMSMNPVPEPATACLLGFALMALAALAYRRGC